MSKDNKDIGILLKRISKSLEKISVQELSTAITAILKKKDNSEKSIYIDYALQIVCEEFNTSKFSLIKSNERGEMQDAKRLAYCLLHYDLQISIRSIASSVFDCYPNSIASGIKKLKNADVNIKHEKAFVEKYYSLQRKLIENITQKQQIQNIGHENLS